MPENTAPLPDFTRWPSFPFEGDMRVKRLAAPVDVEPPRSGDDAGECVACKTPDDAYIWVSERWRVRAMDRPSGLPMVLILECRSHLDLGDLPNLLAAELGVMTVRMERAIRSLDGVARVHVNRWGDGSAHLHMWFLARPYGRLQLRGTFLSLWDDILPVIPERQWRENLAMVAAWLAEFGGQANAEPAHIQWQSPSTFDIEVSTDDGAELTGDSAEPTDHSAEPTDHSAEPTVDEPDESTPPWRPTSLSDVEGSPDAIIPGNGRKAPTVTGSASVANPSAAPATATGTASVTPSSSASAGSVGNANGNPGTSVGTATVTAATEHEFQSGRVASVPRPSPAGDDLIEDSKTR